MFIDGELWQDGLVAMRPMPVTVMRPCENQGKRVTKIGRMCPRIRGDVVRGPEVGLLKTDPVPHLVGDGTPNAFCQVAATWYLGLLLVVIYINEYLVHVVRIERPLGTVDWKRLAPAI